MIIEEHTEFYSRMAFHNAWFALCGYMPTHHAARTFTFSGVRS